MNPEFSSEGEAVQDFLVPDRIVLGGADARTLDLLDELHAGFAGVPKIRTNNRTAEMIKYASNAMLATAISFANEVANLCAALPDVDVVDVTRALHLTRYLTPILADGQRVRAPIASFFEAGCGFGGSCLPKDVKALVACGRALGERMDLLDAVRRVNQDRPGRLVQLLAEGLGGELAGRRVTVLGLAFKPGTDDVRESPAIPVVRDLVARGARVTAYDPAAGREAARALAAEAVRFAGTLEEAIAGAEGIVLVTRWEEFRSLPDLLAGREPAPLLVDGRRLVDRASYGRYIGIGIAHASAPRKTTPEISA
jgi:UDPglucose 6-dehydrogenase/GDP-mannose 6-dehydrogenase